MTTDRPLFIYSEIYQIITFTIIKSLQKKERLTDSVRESFKKFPDIAINFPADPFLNYRGKLSEKETNKMYTNHAEKRAKQRSISHEVVNVLLDL